MMRTGHYGVKGWAKSALEEGLEEVEQGIAGNLINKTMFDHDKPWFSLKDENAVISPYRSAKEFAGGAVAGGILSEAGAGVNRMHGYLSGPGKAGLRTSPDVPHKDTYATSYDTLDQ